MRVPRRWFGGLCIILGVTLLTTTACSPAWAEGDGPLAEDVKILSSEDFEGRGLGTGGLDKARDYVEERFRGLGLEPAGDDGYRQAFPGPNGETLVNLVGRLGDAGGDRHVIVAAHYDHLGKGEPGEANHGLIHPGADDNASGIAVLLECARGFGEAPPASSVLFIAFAGEEKGLLGSAHYVNHPVLPLNQCIAMINLDTVGRLFDDPLMILGAGTAQEMERILQGLSSAFRIPLEIPEKDPGGSDQVSFVQRGVPAVQLFTGPHADYHRPGDTADKVDYDGLERIAGFTTELALYLTERDEALTFLPPGAEKAAAAGNAAPRGGGRRVSFGSIPDFNYEGEGVLLSGVIPDSPAAKAGLQVGDVVVEFAGVALEDLRSYSDVLKSLSPGDEAEVVFLRDGERLTATVTVVERK